jgi:very-short-patch-repair endonuclease
MSVKFTKEDFIKNSNKIHDNKYDYSLVEYEKSSKKVTIICRKHGEFQQRASNHLRGRGCVLCKKSKIYDTNKFIEMSNYIHNNVYEYKKTYYKGSHTYVIITCKKHGDFRQTPTNHLSGKGCSKCATESNRLIINDFIDRSNEIHNFKYDYSLSEYKNIRTKVIIICKEHGNFKQIPKNHLNGQGCPRCGNLFGIKENKWLDYLGVIERQVKIGKYIVDGYEPSTNTIYEFNGDFWHGNPQLYDENDINKVLNKTFGELYKKTINRERYLIKKGYNIISIWENEFDNMFLIF